MKKITDERLIVQNLQHIKIAYIVQTIGVLSILGYEVFKGGIIIALVFAILTSITPNFNWGNGLLIGGIIFVCGVIPVSYVYRLRIKQEKDLEESD